MIRGTLIAESLRLNTALDGCDLRLSRIIRVPTEDQPPIWTFVEFEADDGTALALADTLAAVLESAGGWYCDFRTEAETFVVFSGRIFQYPRGDEAERSEAESYARSVGVPQAQIDWPK